MNQEISINCFLNRAPHQFELDIQIRRGGNSVCIFYTICTTLCPVLLWEQSREHVYACVCVHVCVV